MSVLVWSNTATSILFLYAMLSLSAPFSVTSKTSAFTFPVFSSPDAFMMLEDAKYSDDSLSIIINAAGSAKTQGSCGKLLYAQKVQMKDTASGTVASFSTSFTFTITQQEGVTNTSGWLRESGFAFCFTRDMSITQLHAMTTGSPSCQLKDVATNGEACNHLFSVEFDTYNNCQFGDPSNNHIGVNINSVNSSYTHNLCGGNATNCSYPWNGRPHTAWIEYNSTEQKLRVWLANGSMADGVKRPAQALIQVTGLRLFDVLEDYMYVTLCGSAGSYGESHEFFSWNFTGDDLKEIRSSPFSPRNYNLSESRSSMVSVIVPAIVCASVTIALLFVVYIKLWRRECPKKQSKTLSHLMRPRTFTYKELSKATKNFNESELIGSGGFGDVYRGTLQPSGTVVAVKRIRHEAKHGEKGFLAEASSISQIRHRNLVQLQGWCHEEGHSLLVYDYMSNGSLDEWLFPSRRRRHADDPKYKVSRVLPWRVRLSILTGVASALEYLHEDWVQCILHRDIKSSNVMLDAEFNPHLGDFGLARIIGHEKLEKTTLMAGTLGYMAPELLHTGKASKASDVYSFGILILEVVSGRRPLNLQAEDPDEDATIIHKVWRAHEAGNILSVVDPRLQLRTSDLHPQKPESAAGSVQAQVMATINDVEQCGNRGSIIVSVDDNLVSADAEKEMIVVLQLGMLCCLPSDARPSMRVVQQTLQSQIYGAAGNSILNMNTMPILPSSKPFCRCDSHDTIPPTTSRMAALHMAAQPLTFKRNSAISFRQRRSHRRRPPTKLAMVKLMPSDISPMHLDSELGS